MKKDGFALSVKEWAGVGSAERRGEGSTDKGTLRVSTEGHPPVTGLFFVTYFTEMSLGPASCEAHALPSTNSDVFCHILFHITVRLFFCYLAYGDLPFREPGGPQ